jgi:hypothetical protein
MLTVESQMRSVCIVSLFILHFSLLVACAGFRTEPEAPLLEATAEGLIQLLTERDAAIQTMKGLFRAQVKGPGIPIAQRVEGRLFYRRPDSLRLQGFNHFGGPLFDFRLDHNLYALRLAMTGQVFAGKTSELDRIGKIGRPFRLSVWAVNGAVAVSPIRQDEQVRLFPEGDRYRLDVFASGQPGSPGLHAARRIWFDRRNLEVVEEDLLNESGEVEATIRFSDFRAVASPVTDASSSSAPRAIIKPFKVTTEDGQGQGTLQLLFHEIIPNPPLKPGELEPVRSDAADPKLTS